VGGFSGNRYTGADPSVEMEGTLDGAKTLGVIDGTLGQYRLTSSGRTLAVDPGVVVKFEANDDFSGFGGSRRDVYVHGTLDLRGTASQQVVFCFVPTREGPLRLLAIKPGWDILDNNLLACPRRHVEAVVDMLEGQPKAARFTGGIDARLCRPWFAKRLSRMRMKVRATARRGGGICHSRGVVRNCSKSCGGVFDDQS